MRERNRGLITKVPFTFTLSSAAASFQAPLAPGNMGVRLAAIQDSYEYFRFTKIKFRLIPDFQANVGLGALGFLGDSENTTPPTTTDQVMQTCVGILISDNYSVPTQWVNVPKNILAGAEKWYGCNNTAFANPSGIQGEFCGVQPSAALAFVAEIRGVCEFTVPAAPANTPEITELRLKIHALTVKQREERSRSRLLGQLSPASLTKN